MQTIFECLDKGIERNTLIGYCSDKELAHKVVLGQGGMGGGNGEIRPIGIWETTADIPQEIREIMRKNAEREQDAIQQQADKLTQLLEGASPEVKRKVLAKLVSSK